MRGRSVPAPLNSEKGVDLNEYSYNRHEYITVINEIYVVIKAHQLCGLMETTHFHSFNEL